jgi:glycosyltransferase involved in cell wall biosynthesis
MDSRPEVSVVVATHNRAKRLERLLAGLREQTLSPSRFEVIVVDDGSTDATQDVLAREQARGLLCLTTLAHADPRGPGGARNRGWPVAGAPVVAFTDDDCVPTPTWLEALLGRFNCGDEPIVRGVTVPNPAEAHRLDPYAKTVDISYSSPHYETCNIAYPRALLQRVGGFDESFRIAGEDGDLGWRAAAAGGRPEFAPEAVVHHAVFARGPAGGLRDALLATEGVQIYKRHPQLRGHLAAGVFYNRTHPMLLGAGIGLVWALRQPLALALCVPYARSVRARCRRPGARASHAPFFVAFDAVQMAATIRGAIRNRLPIV